MEWLAFITLHMPDYMWMFQLDEDRDAVSQYRAASGLLRWPSTTAINALNDALTNKNFFYAVRCEAAASMARMSKADTEWLGLDLLLRFFKAHFYSAERALVASNNFEDLPLYYVHRVCHH